MPLHTTKDPVRRAEHIANREQKKHIRLIYQASPTGGYTVYYTSDYPEFWIDVYHEVIEEFVGVFDV